MARFVAAEKAAFDALNGINSHERVCAERYDNIKEKLSGLPRLFQLTEDNKNSLSNDIKYLAKWVYIGMGICLSITTAVEVVHIVGSK